MSFGRSRGDSLANPTTSETRARRPSGSVYVENSFDFGEKLGNGAFGVVYRGTSKADGSAVAIKVIPKDMASGNADAGQFTMHMQQVRNEIAALEKLSAEDSECDCIIGFRGAFETKEKLAIVMDLAHGELADLIAKGSTAVTEKDAQTIITRILTGVAYIHEHDYVHRDLKFENLLMMEKDNFESIVLTDFGLATKSNEAAPGECGTPLYMSPEIWMRNSVAHGPKVDIWAVGIISFILLCGHHPIKAKSVEQLKAKICVDRVELEFTEGVSDPARDFVRRLLTADPISRPAAKDALAHPFISGDSSSDLNDSVVDMMRAYAAEMRLKKGVNVVDAVARMKILSAQSRASGEDDSAPDGLLMSRIPGGVSAP